MTLCTYCGFERGGVLCGTSNPEACAKATAEAEKTERYDYVRQAWVVEGRYAACGHQSACRCYGRAHAGEVPS